MDSNAALTRICIICCVVGNTYHKARSIYNSIIENSIIENSIIENSIIENLTYR